VPTTRLPDYFDQDAMRYFKQFEEKLGDKKHRLLNDDERPAFVPGVEDFPFKAELPLQCRGGRLQGAGGALFHDGRQPG
jgi:signal peptidase I